MKKALFTCLMYLICCNFAHCSENNINYNEIYNNLPLLDFNYEYNKDPEDYYNYEKYIASPYPLFRLTSVLHCKNAKLQPGYYLLTPEMQNGFNYVLFKQKGSIKAIIPVYEKTEINPKEVYRKPPESKVKWYKKPVVWCKKAIKFTFGRLVKPPEMPKAGLIANEVDGGKYFSIKLYRENYLYKMIFKTDK